MQQVLLISLHLSAALPLPSVMLASNGLLASVCSFGKTNRWSTREPQIVLAYDQLRREFLKALAIHREEACLEDFAEETFFEKMARKEEEMARKEEETARTIAEKDREIAKLKEKLAEKAKMA
jgi:hypothetical protein